MIEVGSIKATVGLDAADFKQGIDQVKAGLSEGARMTQDALRAMDDYNRKLAAGIDPARALAAVQRQEAAAVREVTALQARLNEARDGGNKIVQDAAAKYSGLSNARRAEIVELKEELAAVNKTSQSLKSLGTDAAQTGRLLSVGLSAPLLGIGGFALDASQQIQKAMNSIRTETGATGDRLAGLGQSFREVASQVPQSMDIVGKAVATVAQRTGQTGAALTQLSTQFLTLARVTGGQVDPLITNSTKIFQQWGVSVNQQGEVLNQFLRTHEATGIGVQELTEKILRFGPALKTVGLSLADAEALLGAFNKQGVVGDKALTALNTTFAKWAKAGITDAHTALANLIAAVEKAPTAFDALKIATEAGMGGRGGADFVNAVRSGGFEMQKFLKIITDGKDTVKKAGDDTLTVANQFQQLRNKIILAAEPLGTFIAQKLKDLGKALDEDIPKLKELGNGFERQSGAVKNAEGALALFGIALGPVVLAIGRIAQGWRGFTALLALGIPAVAMGSVVAFFGAILFNFHGLRDDFLRGWQTLWQTALGNLKAFGDLAGQIIDIIFHPSSDAMERARRAWEQFGKDTADSFVSAQRAAMDHNPVQSELGHPTLTPQMNAALKAFGPPVLPPVTGAGGSGTLSGGDPNAAPNLKAETEAHRLLKEALTGEAKAQEILSLMQQGYTQHQADVISRYTAVNDKAIEAALSTHRQVSAIALHIEALNAQAMALEKTRRAHESANRQAEEFVKKTRAAMEAMRQEMAGSGPTRVPQVRERFAGASPALATSVAKVQTEDDAVKALYAKFKADQTKAAQEIASLGSQADAALAKQAERHTELAGATRQDATALEVYQKLMASGNPLLQEKADRLLALVAANDQLEDSQKILLRLDTEYGDVLMKVAAAGKATADRELELHGASKQLTAAQDALNAAWRQGDEFLIDLAGSFVDAERAQDAFAKSQAAARKLGGELQAAYNREIDRGIQQAEAATGTTHETAVAQQLLNQAMKSGSEEQVLFAAQILALAKAHDAAALAAKGQAKEERAQQQFLKRIATDTASTFANLFTDLYEHGFKGFFAKVIHGFSDMFRQIAADAVRSQVKGLVERLLGIGVSALAGGGGGGGAADLAAAGVNDGGALMQALPTFASGGNFFAGQPFIAGERGPELVLPRTSGTVIPHGQTAALQQQRPIVVNMTVHAADAQSFRRNSGALASDLHQKLAIANRRNG